MKSAQEKELQIAIKLLSKSKLVQNWAIGEARAYGIDPESPERKEFLKQKCREYARKLLTE